MEGISANVHGLSDLTFEMKLVYRFVRKVFLRSRTVVFRREKRRKEESDNGRNI